MPNQNRHKTRKTHFILHTLLRQAASRNMHLVCYYNRKFLNNALGAILIVHELKSEVIIYNQPNNIVGTPWA